MRILMVCMLIAIDSRGEMPKSRFAFKMYTGISFLKTTVNHDNLLTNKIIPAFSPEFSYNFALKKGNCLELGLRLYTIGNRLVYNDNPYTDGVITNKFAVLSLPICYHHQLGVKTQNLSLSAGFMLFYLSNRFLFVNDDTLFLIHTSSSTGLRVNLNIGFRYIFNTKKQKFGLDINYSQGMANFYKIHSENHMSNLENRYIHKGSSVNLGLIFFFGGNSKKDRVVKRMNKRIHKGK